MEEDKDQLPDEIGRMIQTYFDALKNNICPTCNQPIAERRQVGRCVYAAPCGHRLYQGKISTRKGK